MSIYEEKKRLRIEVLDAIQNLSKNKIRKESEHICKEIAERIPLDSAVCAYSALPDEIDLKPLIKLLIQRGNSVFLPCYEKNMVFRKIDNNTELKKGSYGILEPVSSSTIILPEEINIVLVPGRAFDEKGNRLGRGKGIYDDWINKQRNMNKSTQFWGIAFKSQMIDSVPTEEHDQKMDKVLT